jgi:hypothetical protein
MLYAFKITKMEHELTLRDKLALSMPKGALPKLTNQETINYIADKLSLEWSDDLMKQIDFAFKYQAIMRYQYADALIKVRGK